MLYNNYKKNKGTFEYTRRKRTRNKKIIKNKRNNDPNLQDVQKRTIRLEQFGVKMDDMDMFVKSVVGMSKANYDYVQILAKIAEHEKLEKDLDYYKEEITRTKNESAKLNQEIHNKKNDLNYYKIKLDFLNEFEGRDFGIEEFRTFINMLNEIGMEHNHNL